MTEKTMLGEWDEVFDKGVEWQDELTTELDGKPVTVKRRLSPAGPDFVRVTFADGSIFYFGFDAWALIGRANPDSELAAANIADGSAAFGVYAPMIKALYDKATHEKIDVDI